MPLSEQLRAYCQLVETLRLTHEAHAAAGAAAGVSDDSDMPDEFLDPITMSLMKDPVKLPDSQVTVDRQVCVAEHDHVSHRQQRCGLHAPGMQCVCH
eukprot:jgi/Chrzof1/7630/Cz02g30250.t1